MIGIAAGLVMATTPARAEPSAVHLAVQLGESDRVTAVAVAGDGEVAMTVNEHGVATVWDTRIRQSLRSFAVSAARAVALTHDGRVAVVASKSGELASWDVVTGKKLASLGQALEGAQGFAIHPEQPRGLVAASATGPVNEVELTTGKVLRAVRPKGAAVRALAYEARGLALVASEGVVEARDTATSRVERRIPKSADAVAAAPGAKIVAIGIGDSVEVYEGNAAPKRARVPDRKSVV